MERLFLSTIVCRYDDPTEGRPLTCAGSWMPHRSNAAASHPPRFREAPAGPLLGPGSRGSDIG